MFESSPSLKLKLQNMDLDSSISSNSSSTSTSVSNMRTIGDSGISTKAPNTPNIRGN